MRLTSQLSIAFASSLLIGCSSTGWGSQVYGEGPYIDSDRSLEGFESLSMSGGMAIDITIGSPQSVVIFAEENLHEYIRTRVVDGTLKIDFTESISTSEPVRAEITVASLESISLSGSSKLSVNSLDEDEFILNVSGSVRGEISGDVRDLEVNIAGSGKLKLFGLNATDAEIDISGSGNVEIAVSDSLDVDIAGSGVVTYVGTPALSTSFAGSGKVRRKDG
ncbi:MAG: hypothetical protein ACI8X5_001780 [Planctomycetota bacterium]|jgi:hypothetical protein